MPGREGLASRVPARLGQSIVEYTVLIGVVLTALSLMHPYVRRALQGRMRDAAAASGGLTQYNPYYTLGQGGFRSRLKANYAFSPGGVVTGGSTLTVWGPCENPGAADCPSRTNEQVIGGVPP